MLADGKLSVFNGVVYVQVDNLPASCKKARELGGTIPPGFPFDLPGSQGAIALVTDPTLAVWTQVLHSVSFSPFLIGGVAYVDEHTPAGLSATAQAVYTAATFGVGAALGVVLVLGGTYVFSLGNLVSLRATGQGIDLPNAVVRGMTWGTLFLTLFALARGSAFTIEWTPTYLLSLVYLALPGSIVAFLGLFVGPWMIRKLPSGKYRLYSRTRSKKTGKRKNLGTFDTRAAAEKRERAVQFFKRRG